MTDPAHFERLSECFESIRRLPVNERSAAIDAIGDPALRAGVAHLLAHHDGTSPLDAGAPGVLVGQIASEVAAGAAAETPERIGPHRVIRLIGAGGMGDVYEAEQDTPHRRVAVKIIKLGMDTKQIIARFEAERQALAMMDHPGIARVFDAGATETGRPYFVMELVDGVPLLQYCDDARLDTRGRLDLFAKVCHAIQHAHQKGIIHRDIKPSNVLVHVEDGVATPKVIDFGIAKAVDTDLTAQTLFTQLGQVVGTPAYMSPEQAALTERDIDTRSDIYSLGVLLYELLTGETPFDLHDTRDHGVSEMMRVIREEEPARPSSRFVSTDDTATRTAGQRGTDVERLRLLLRGDLDWIVLTCLEKDRTRRYASASALAEDVDRYLTDQPVLASPQTASYRLRKFVRRNRAKVAAMATIATLLVVAIIGTTGGMIWALAERGRATHAAIAEADARDVAVNQVETAEEIISFLLDDLLGAADPARTENRNLTVRDAVALASEAVEGRFTDRPEVEVRVRHTLALVLTQLGAYPEAEPHIRRELELSTQLHGAASDPALAARTALGTNLLLQSRFDDAIDNSTVLLDLIGKPENDEQAARQLAARATLGVLYLQSGRNTEAAPILEETLAARRERLGARHPDTLASLHNLAGLYGQLGQPERSLEYSREAYAGRLDVLGAGDPKTFGSLNLIFWMLRYQERWDELEAQLDDAVATAEDRLGPEHPMTIQLTKTYALQFRDRGRHDEAEAILRRVVAIQREQDPEIANINTVSTIQNLATTLAAQGRHDAAIEHFEVSTAAARRLYPAGSREIAACLLQHGRSLTGVGRFADSEALLLECHSILTHLSVRRAAMMADVATALAELYRAWDAAEPGAGYAERADAWETKKTDNSS